MLAEQLKHCFPATNFIICRECLMDGPLQAPNWHQFWQLRQAYISSTYLVSERDYQHRTLTEISKLTELSSQTKVYLWFENDLFCQANMWCMLSLLSEMNHLSIYRVMPLALPDGNVWDGFAHHKNKELLAAFSKAISLSEQEINLGQSLWQAFQNNNFNQLLLLAKNKQRAFPYLKAVCTAHKLRFSKESIANTPIQLLKAIIESNPNVDFTIIFKEFSAKAGIYGMSDLQVKQLLNSILY